MSEFGGIGWFPKEDGTSWGYGDMPKTKEEFLERLEGLVSTLLDNATHFGFCYTQLTDVEQEKNGLFTFDRQPKFDLARLRAILQREAAAERWPKFEERPPYRWQVLLGTAHDGPSNLWRTVEAEPPTLELVRPAGAVDVDPQEPPPPRATQFDIHDFHAQRLRNPVGDRPKALLDCRTRHRPIATFARTVAR